MLDSGDKIFAFCKTHHSASHEILVLLNFSDEQMELSAPVCGLLGPSEVLVSNAVSEGSSMNAHLQPWEGTALLRPASNHALA